MPASTVAKAEQAVTPTEFTSPCTQERFLTNAEEGATRGFATTVQEIITRDTTEGLRSFVATSAPKRSYRSASSLFTSNGTLAKRYEDLAAIGGKSNKATPQI